MHGEVFTSTNIFTCISVDLYALPALCYCTISCVPSRHCCHFQNMRARGSCRVSKHLLNVMEEGVVQLSSPIFEKIGSTYFCLQKYGLHLPSDKRDYLKKCTRNKFNSFRQLIDHLRDQHNVKFLCDKRCFCVICDLIFTKPADGVIHFQSRCDQNLHVCHICPKKFDSYRGLTLHLKGAHKLERVKEICCDFCDKNFKSKVYLLINTYVDLVICVNKICISAIS